ncbi:MAG: DNA cytosine methyltransferase [Desulfovibrionaceae bacterium]
MKCINLFAGIGGFYIGLKRNNMVCVFASEINVQEKYTQLITPSPFLI